MAPVTALQFNVALPELIFVVVNCVGAAHPVGVVADVVNETGEE